MEIDFDNERAVSARADFEAPTIPDRENFISGLRELWGFYVISITITVVGIIGASIDWWANYKIILSFWQTFIGSNRRRARAYY